MDFSQIDFGAVVLSYLHGGLKLLQVVLIFSILVIAHEYGHFLAAKAVAMRVDEFSVGFGKILFSKKRGETLYSLRLWPFGGFNRIYGMDIEEPEDEAGKSKKLEGAEEAEKSARKLDIKTPDYSVAPKDDPRAFVNRPLFHRFLVIVCGPLANLVIAVLVVFLMGITIGFPAAEIGGVIPGGPAEGAGLMKDDIITRFNGVRLSSTIDLQQAIALSNGRSIELAGYRGTEAFSINVVPQATRIVDNNLCRLGFIYLNDGTVIDIIPGSPAARTNLALGDIIVEVDGLKFPSHNLDIEGGNNILNLKVFRGFILVSIAMVYFDSEIIRENYSEFGFTYDDDRKITYVASVGLAGEKGLEPGDVITGGSTLTWLTGTSGVSTLDPNPTTIEYERDGVAYRAAFNPGRAFSRIQVFMDNAAAPVLVSLPYKNRLYQAGMRSGDEILSVEGVPTPNGISAFLEMQKHLGETITIMALRQDEEKAFTITFPSENNINEVNALFGGLNFKTKYFVADPWNSLVTGVRTTQGIAGYIFTVIGMLINGEASVTDLAGPVGIVTITYEAASNGFVDLIHIMVLLSVNLAIFNLLPFPLLDGGRIILMIPELIMRRQVISVRVENLIHLAGFVLIILFALFVTYHDITRLLFGR